MILQGQHHLKTAKKYKRVHQIHMAYDNTFLLFAQRDNRQDVIAHVNFKGQIFFQHPFEHSVESIAMISPKKVVVLETRENSLIAIDIENHKFKRISHQFMAEESDRSNALTFTTSQFLGIEEKGVYNDSRYKLSYYHYEDFQEVFNENEKSNGHTNHKQAFRVKPFWVYESSEDQWTYDQTSFKANNHSMVVWFNGLNSGISFTTYSLDQNNKGHLRTLNIRTEKIETALRYIPKIEIKNCKEAKVKLAIGLLKVWESQRNIFWIQCLSNCQNQREDSTVKLLIFDSILDQLKQSKLSLGKIQEQITDCVLIGNKSLLVTYEESQERVCSSHLLFIDNSSQAIIGANSWQYNSVTHFQPSHHDSYSLLQATYSKLDIERFFIKIIRLLKAKQLYIHIMFELYPDFDDGLVSEVLKSLKNCQ